MFFFFFFDELYHKAKIHQAFKNICLDKMVADGYFDMSYYINAKVKKEEFYCKLSNCNSKYAVLYANTFPNENDAVKMWDDIIGEADVDENLSTLESIAIVYWVYKILNNKNERQEFTKALLQNIKEFLSIANDVKFSSGIVYNNEKVEIHFLHSVADVNKFTSSLTLSQDENLFFRGHSNVNYKLIPSVMRLDSWKQNEHRMYNDIIIDCPDSFANCNTHLERLVEMQHYGLPTRLLDVTRNPLVALYFACENQSERYGEIVLLSANSQSIKYPNSDTVSILASLAAIDYSKKETIAAVLTNQNSNDYNLQNTISHLIREIRLEKPSFLAEIELNNLLENYFVYALKNNNRIVKQDGAFIICGLNNNDDLLSNHRYKNKITNKKIVLLIDNKQEIMNQLNTLSINRATLFPEIECVAEFIKDKYSRNR